MDCLSFQRLNDVEQLLTQEYVKNQTIMDQGQRTDCFFRLLIGRVRFEKRQTSDQPNSIFLGSMECGDNWNCFGEVTALGVQARTSCAVIADSEKVVVEVVPANTFFNFAQENPDFERDFFLRLCIKFAGLLKGIETRKIQRMDSAIGGSSLNGEVVLKYWKTKFRKSEGLMVLSTNHLAFVKKKQTKKGGISDIGLSSSFTVEISSVGAIALDEKNKLEIWVGKEKCVFSFPTTEQPKTIKSIIEKQMGKSARFSKTGYNFKRLEFCRKCTESFCSYCQTLPMTKNRCAVGRHEFSQEGSNQYLGDPEGTCGRCGNEGTHFLPSTALSELLSKSAPQILKPNDKIIIATPKNPPPLLPPPLPPKVLKQGGPPLPAKKIKEPEQEQSNGVNGAVVYCLEGSLTVSYGDLSSELSEGECFGEVGAFLNDLKASPVITAGSEGCSILLIDNALFRPQKSSPPFLSQFYFGFVQTLWEKILKLETKQAKKSDPSPHSQLGTPTRNDSQFLNESLLRDTGKAIDSSAGWFLQA